MKRYKLGLILGRFQGIHKGHESIIEKGLELCDEVLVFVGSSDKEGTSTNPFPYELRRDMLISIYGDKIHIFPLPDLGVGNVPKWGDYVIENAEKCIGRPDIIIYGEEPKCNTWYKNFSDIDYIGVDREIVPINATALRKFIKENDEESFKKYTNPKIHHLYNELRQALLKAEK